MQQILTASAGETGAPLASKNGVLPTADFESAVAFCSTQLWHLAKQEKEITYAEILKSTKKHVTAKLTRETFKQVLQIVNERAWRKYHVLLTVIVVMYTEQMPGTGFFVQARKLGAVSTFPNDLESRRQLTKRLQMRLFVSSKLIANL
jgi:hypothetical protein